MLPSLCVRLPESTIWVDRGSSLPTSVHNGRPGAEIHGKGIAGGFHWKSTEGRSFYQWSKFADERNCSAVLSISSLQLRNLSMACMCTKIENRYRRSPKTFGNLRQTWERIAEVPRFLQLEDTKFFSWRTVVELVHKLCKVECYLFIIDASILQPQFTLLTMQLPTQSPTIIERNVLLSPEGSDVPGSALLEEEWGRYCNIPQFAGDITTTWRHWGSGGTPEENGTRFVYIMMHR